MPIDVTCPKCNLILPAPEEYAGKRIRCADCSTIVDVPVPGASTVDQGVSPLFARKPTSDSATAQIRRNRSRKPDPAKPWLPIIVGVLLAAIVGTAGTLWYFQSGTEPKPNQEPDLRATIPTQQTAPTDSNPPKVQTLSTGLKLHLTFESKLGNQTYDPISRKYVGRFADTPEIIEGKRDKAIKLSIPVRTGTLNVPFALDLSDVRDRFALADKAALTIAMWSKVDSTSMTYALFLGADRILERPRIYFSMSRSTSSCYLQLETIDSAFASTVLNGDPDWHHLAVRRTASGVWSVAFDGVPRELSGKNKPSSNSAFTFPRIGVGAAFNAKSKEIRPTIAIDDLRVYDRALSDAEIATLAGKD